MKVTVQNGANHGLSRRDVEKVISTLPSSLKKEVRSIVLYSSSGLRVRVDFHSKERIIGLYWPQNCESNTTKDDAVEELLVGLSVVQELGYLPNELSKSVREKHILERTDLINKCKNILS